MKNKILNRLKRMICGFAPIIVCFSLFSFTSKNYIKKDTVVINSFKLKTIIVDAGHGGKKTGAFGSYSVEKNVTLAIALKLQKAIEKEMNGVNVIMTRTTDDDVAFRSRADIANSNHGNVFISIHCNSL